MNTNATPATDYDRIWDNVYGDIQDIGPTHRHLQRILKQILASLDYQSVLDVGCGFGHHLPLLTEGRLLKSVAGIDVSKRAIAHVRQSFHGSFHRLDIQKQKLDERWDLVFSSLLLEHLDDDLAALRQMRAMTGKYLLLATMSGPFERYKRWEQKMGHVRNYRTGELETKLEQAGFSVEKAIYWGFPFYSPMARLLQNRMQAKRELGMVPRLIAKLLYYLYFLNCSKKGDLLIILAHV